MHLKHDRQFKDHFCPARTVQLLPDSKGMVRYVIVTLRDNKTGPGGRISNQQAGQLLELTVAVQRLHVILPVEDQTPGALKVQLSN